MADYGVARLENPDFPHCEKELYYLLIIWAPAVSPFTELSSTTPILLHRFYNTDSTTSTLPHRLYYTDSTTPNRGSL
ncbi:hypothetical protein DAPPUDRAFT_276010, partial [Daphnia pulex]